MKKRSLSVLAVVMTTITILSGCGLWNDDAVKATEYVNEALEAWKNGK